MLLTRTVRRDDIDLHVRFRPGTPTVAVLHGLAGTGEEWNGVIDALPDEVGVIAPDLRAHGDSRGPTTPSITADAFTVDTETVLATLAPGPVVLVGQSMGGVIALRVAARRPDLVRHLVLVDAGIAALDDDLSDLDHWLRTTDTGHDPDSMVETIRAVAAEPRDADWQAFTGPRTVVLAQRSFIDADDVARMATIAPRTTWHSVLESGHDVHLDRPDALAAVLIDLC